MQTKQLWEEAQIWEKNWHNNCVNSYQEETKQLEYAKRMGLVVECINGKYPVINFHNKTVIDIGGGPYSLLLKGINLEGTVVDPLDMPQWCKDRYKIAGINLIQKKAEDFITDEVFDECVAYNLLQHTDNPAKIVSNMLSYSRLVRVFDWINTPVSDGHIHTLKETELNEWFGGKGIIGYQMWGDIEQPYYYGVFLGNN